MERYVIYRRVSTKKQGDSGLGLEAQDRDIGLFLEGYAGSHEVIATYTEIESGASGVRPELFKAIETAKDRKAYLLVAKLDRLSRKVSFIAALMDDPRVLLRVASMPHADKFQLHIYAALAEQEREFISRRTKAALAEAKKRGTLLGGRRPGQEKRHKAVSDVADHNAMRVIETIRQRRKTGSTLQEIADELNKLGVATARGGKWYPSTVRNYALRLAESVAEWPSGL